MAKLHASEHQEQVAVFQWADLQKSKNPELELLFAIPNGGFRNIVTAKKLKKEGVRSGVPDMFLPVPRGTFCGLFVELKTHVGIPSENQKKWLWALSKQGYMVITCHGSESAINEIKNYLKLRGFK